MSTDDPWRDAARAGTGSHAGRQGVGHAAQSARGARPVVHDAGVDATAAPGAHVGRSAGAGGSRRGALPESRFLWQEQAGFEALADGVRNGSAARPPVLQTDSGGLWSAGLAAGHSGEPGPSIGAPAPERRSADGRRRFGGSAVVSGNERLEKFAFLKFPDSP